MDRRPGPRRWMKPGTKGLSHQMDEGLCCDEGCFFLLHQVSTLITTAIDNDNDDDDVILRPLIPGRPDTDDLSSHYLFGNRCLVLPLDEHANRAASDEGKEMGKLAMW